jgi:hypothetical protein
VSTQPNITSRLSENWKLNGYRKVVSREMIALAGTLEVVIKKRVNRVSQLYIQDIGKGITYVT